MNLYFSIQPCIIKTCFCQHYKLDHFSVKKKSLRPIQTTVIRLNLTKHNTCDNNPLVFQACQQDHPSVPDSKVAHIFEDLLDNRASDSIWILFLQNSHLLSWRYSQSKMSNKNLWACWCGLWILRIILVFWKAKA